MQFSNTDNSIVCPVFSPCANYFATFANNNLYIKDGGCSDLKNHAQIPFKEKQKTIIKPTGYLKFSPDSKLFAIKIDKRVQVYDIHGNLKSKIRDQFYEVEEFVWSEDSFPYQLIVFYSGLTYCIIYNLQTHQESYLKNNKFKKSNGYTFSKGSHPGVFMALLQRHSNKDCIGIYYTKTFQMLNFITLDTFDAAKIEFTANGDLIVIENKINFKIYIVDPFRGVTNSYGEKEYCLGVSAHKLSNTQHFLALGVHDDCIHILNTATWKPICEIQVTQKLDLSKTTLYKEQNQQFSVIRQGKCKLAFKKQNKQSDQANVLGISLLEFSPQDEYLAVKIDTISNCVFIYDICSLELITVIQTAKTVKDFKWLQSEGDSRVLCIATNNKGIFIWKDTNREGQLFEISVPGNNINISNIELGKDGKMILFSPGQKKYTYALYDNSSSNDRVALRF